ncbi:MAG: hypothetical protein ACE5EA_03580 [Nitrospirota bacterium]
MSWLNALNVAMENNVEKMVLLPVCYRQAGRQRHKCKSCGFFPCLRSTAYCLLFIIYCLISLAACGNPKEEDNGSPPEISNLSITNPVPDVQPGLLDVSGTVDFIDRDRDVIGYKIFIQDGSTNEFILKNEADLSGREEVNGQFSSRMNIIFVIDTTGISSFKVRVIVFDSKGNESNNLEEEITVCSSGTAAADCLSPFR